MLRFDLALRAPLGAARVDYASTAALTGAVLRLSGNPSVAADRRLPARGSPGSLGAFFVGVGGAALAADTTPPAARGVAAAGGAAVAAHRVSTLDLEVVAAAGGGARAARVVNGSFRVFFGDAAVAATACVDAAAVDAALLAAALRAAYGPAAAAVAEQPVAGGVARRRFLVEVAEGYGGALGAEVCEPLECAGVVANASRVAGDPPPAACATVTADADGPRGGTAAVAVGVAFSAPVVAAGGARLPLAGGGAGFLARSHARTQLVDVGVGGSSRLAGGEFALLYGSARTRAASDRLVWRAPWILFQSLVASASRAGRFGGSP